MAREFRLRRRVQFAETDLAGVLHFSNYLRLMEEAEHAFWRSLGLSVVMERDDGKVSWPRVAVRCEYFAPARFEDELDLRVIVAEIGEKSLRLEVEFQRGHALLARGEMKMVCCRMAQGAFSSIPIPDDIRARLDGSV